MKPRIQLLLREIKLLEEEVALIERRKEEFDIIQQKIEDTKTDFFKVNDQVEKEYSDVIKIEKKFNRKYLRRNTQYLQEQYDKEKQEYFIIQSRFKALQNMLEGYKYQASILEDKLNNTDVTIKSLLDLKIKLFKLVTDEDQALELKFNHLHDKIELNSKKKQDIEIQKDGIEQLNEQYISLCKLLDTPRKWTAQELLHSSFGVAGHRRKHWTIGTLDHIQRTKQEFNHLDVLSRKLESGLQFSYFKPRWELITTIVSASYSNQNWFLRDLQLQIETINGCVKQHDFLLKTIDESLEQISKSNQKLIEQRDTLLNEQIESYE